MAAQAVTEGFLFLLAEDGYRKAETLDDQGVKVVQGDGVAYRP